MADDPEHPKASTDEQKADSDNIPSEAGNIHKTVNLVLLCEATPGIALSCCCYFLDNHLKFSIRPVFISPRGCYVVICALGLAWSAAVPPVVPSGTGSLW